MGDLAEDTTLTPVDDSGLLFQAELNDDWALIGPNGGYLAAVALRAAAAATTLPRPASLSCQFLSPPRFGLVELEVVRLRATRRAAALRVSMRQFGKPVLEALVWAAHDGLSGPRTDWTPMPSVPPPDDLPDLKDLLVAEGRGIPPWHDSVNLRELSGRTTQKTPAPVAFCWGRFLPRSTFDGDCWLDACRSVVLIDSLQWPAVMNAFPELEQQLFAPSIDLYVGFHDFAVADPWLLVDASGRAAGGSGVLAGDARVWAPDGRLLATGAQQMLSTSTRRNAALASMGRRA
ncbi:acyl-CoA thioesterase domain-containing protein [Actinokineospora enzanensis]|uniref:acyl-CoA thioesterase domain-containing protein n=1 Tax=Actinokineospora enzanensis TaxID=155975 RepID=UPI00037EA29D|nr:acyl-CoA thioesterase domain-containing protein [Actinokineospora enzanensis]